jgi:hypothetical protein
MRYAPVLLDAMLEAGLVEADGASVSMTGAQSTMVIRSPVHLRDRSLFIRDACPSICCICPYHGDFV